MYKTEKHKCKEVQNNFSKQLLSYPNFNHDPSDL